MKHNTRIRELTTEVLVGTFMFVVLLVLSIFTIVLSRENLMRKSYTFAVVFDSVMGLREGDNVVVRGVPVGKVRELSLGEKGVRVVCSLDVKLRMREDYRIEIVSTSVLGGRYLLISEGSPNKPELPDRTEFQGIAPVDFIAEASAVIVKIKKSLNDTRILENLGAAVSNLTAVSEKISRGEGTIGKLVNDQTLYDDAQEIIAELRAAIKERRILADIESSAANLRKITDKIEQGDGTLGRLVNDPALYDDAAAVVSDLKAAVRERHLLANIEKSVANLEGITRKIASGEGTIGKIVNSEDLYDQAIRAMDDARAALDDLRETTPISTFTSIFFGAF